MLISVIKVFVLSTLAFVVTILWTPLLTKFLYKYKLGKQIRDEASAPIYSKMHQVKSGTPTMGGMLIWVTTAILAVAIFYLAKITNFDLFNQLFFLDRSQTLLPLGVLVASAIVGLIDDFFNVKKVGPRGGGLKMKHRLLIYAAIAAVGAWWFFVKLQWSVIHVPFVGDFNVGGWFIPLFIFVVVATAFSVNEIDGLDGLAGGTLLMAFAAYGAIAFIQGKYDLATFCGVIIGSLVAFLWFNIFPARFFMGDTGAMSLGITLGVLAMFTNYFLLLPIIGFLFVVESGSVIIQQISKKVRKKKVFLSAPIHHHLEASGWPEPKIVMRFWLISGVTAVLGLIIFMVERIL
ncbi:MAG: phospho-N-acetylmuramoyl-pentapeptide-transferase [Candidatus Parcubacteria bacterium]|nr:phospho-N-acetylmuramoyl-pentapeptide-transferase [Candidatus Parcubacteria bacterium]